MTFTSTVDAALQYAERGWPVFPCKPAPDKTPLTEHGFKDATTDKDLINKWWRRWPKAQVGLACGAAGVCVLDLDVGGGKDGVAALEAVRGLEPTGCALVACTPRGGRHLFYLAPDPPVGCGVDVLAVGVDVRADGGYVILPSPASPGREWVEGDPFAVHDDGTTDGAQLPAWLLALLRGTGDTATARGNSAGSSPGDRAPLLLTEQQVATIREALWHVPNDDRKVWLRMGMAMKSTGAGEQAFAVWDDWSQHAHQPDGAVHPKYKASDQRKQWNYVVEYRLDGTEVAIGTLFWTAKHHGWSPPLDRELEVDVAILQLADPSGAPVVIAVPAAPAVATRRQLTAAPPCPIDLSGPGLLHRIAGWVANSAPRRLPALAFGAALATLAAVMGRRVRTKTGLRTNLYVLGLAETAFGKGATLNLPRTLLAHAGLEKFVGPGSWKSDSGLRAAVQAQATHVAMVDEFTQHMKSMVGERAPAHLKGIRTLMLDLFDKADSVHLAPAYADREKSKPVTLVEPCFSIYGVGVPGQMCDGLDRGALTDGFLNRFLVFFAEDELPTRQWECGGAPPADLVADLVAFDKALEPAGVGNLQGKGKTTSLAVPTACRTVAFADDAFAAWKEVGGEQDSLIRRLTKDGDPMKDLWCRMGEHAGKVALVMAVAEDPAGRIETHHVGKARDLVVWCLTRMQCLAERRLHDSRSEAEVQRMLRVIESAGPKGIAMNPLTRRTQWLRRGDRKDHLQTLVDGGEVVTPQRPTGSRAPAIYIAASKLSDAELMEITGATSVETETSGAQPSDVNGRQGSVLTPENRANLNGDHT